LQFDMIVFQRIRALIGFEKASGITQWS
jgi:hypothetical protein